MALSRAIPKLRERAQGAAVPLDESDEQLLNLLQSKFPLTERPFEQVAVGAGMTEDEVMSRTQQLLDDRIIREITPIFDTPRWVTTRCSWLRRWMPAIPTAPLT